MSTFLGVDSMLLLPGLLSLLRVDSKLLHLVKLRLIHESLDFIDLICILLERL